ncbi:hypothetical protein RCU45_24320, partial [Escherichia coli]|nr:hypothetical protein [Escherichia coli]MED0091675.1 hypothetical protein [Escherichia coli]
VEYILKENKNCNMWWTHTTSCALRHFRFMLIRHLSKTGAGIETPDNAKGDTDAKSVFFLCHAIAQPYVAFSSEINGSAGWAAERQAGSLLRR